MKTVPDIMKELFSDILLTGSIISISGDTVTLDTTYGLAIGFKLHLTNDTIDTSISYTNLTNSSVYYVTAINGNVVTLNKAVANTYSNWFIYDNFQYGYANEIVTKRKDNSIIGSLGEVYYPLIYMPLMSFSEENDGSKSTIRNLRLFIITDRLNEDKSYESYDRNIKYIINTIFSRIRNGMEDVFSNFDITYTKRDNLVWSIVDSNGEAISPDLDSTEITFNQLSFVQDFCLNN